LEPFSKDIVKTYTGEEVGVGLHDIGNTIVETWSAISVTKGYLEESYTTDTGGNFLNIINGGKELWKKHNTCLSKQL
jgi:hypothetical protein